MFPILFNKRSGGGLTYLLKDLFTTADAAPITSPRTCEPGPGTLTFDETDGSWAISGTNLVWTAQSTPAWGAQGFWGAAQTRAAGLGLITSATITTWEECGIGWDNAGADADPDTFENAIQLNTADGRIDNNSGALIKSGLATSTAYGIASILRTTGAFHLISVSGTWQLLWVDNTGTTSAIYPVFANLDGAGNLDYLKIASLPSPWNDDYGIALNRATFTAANTTKLNTLTNEKGGAWTAGDHWTVSSNKAICAPTAGSELWDAAAAVFTSGTYAWTVIGTNTIANVSNALEITYVNDANGAQVLFRDTADLSSDLTVGQWYIYQCDSKINSSNHKLAVYDGANQIVGDLLTNTAFATNYHTFNARSATAAKTYLGNFSAGEVVTLDNLSLKPLTLTDLLAEVQSSENDVHVIADVTVTTGTQAGVCTHLDSAGTPANFLLCYHDGTKLWLEKCVAGTYTTLINAAATYSAGARIYVIAYKSGSNLLVSAYYNNARVGTEQTISDAGIVDNTLHGLFSTYSGNTLDNFEVFPRNPSSGVLDQYANG